MSSARFEPKSDHNVIEALFPDAAGGHGRRDFLAYAASLPFLSLIGLGLATTAVAAENGAVSERALTAFLDTLLPADGESPAASRLNIHRVILEASTKTPNYPELLAYGSAWMNQNARARRGVDFADLAEPERAPIVETMEQAQHGTVPQVYFERIRTDAFRAYYMRPESWPGLRFDGPPQPAGFTDFADKPAP